MSILIVDDDRELADLIAYALRRAGFQASGVFGADEAVRAYDQQRPGLLIVDVNLPSGGAARVVEHVRRRGNPGLIVLSERNEEREVIGYLELGADDFIVKPFRPGELVARVRALLRRVGPASSQAASWEGSIRRSLTLGPLHVDVDRHEVMLAGQPVRLTPTAFKLLYFLAVNRDRVMSVDAIFSYVWGYEHGSESAGQIVRVNIARLRRGLAGHPLGGSIVQTVPGVGYVLRVQTPSLPAAGEA